MILLQVKNAEKVIGERLLFDDASCALGSGQKIGFIGRNGAGKSTMCRVLLGTEELDGGVVDRHPDLRLGYLEQHDPFEPGDTVIGFLMRRSGESDWRCGEVAGRFELKDERLTGPVSALSGGWQTRVKLAAILLESPNFLILDEPTNFLDLRTQMLLERFLRSYQGALLCVSHDRAFLEATCDTTLEIALGKLTLYPGTVESYLAAKEENRSRLERANHGIRSKRRQLEKFIAKNKAGANTASQARSKEKQLEKLALHEVGGRESVVKLRLPNVPPPRGTALLCERLAIGYPDAVVATGIDVEVPAGQRVVVLGQNGEGKTTFLNTVTGELPAKAGRARWGQNSDVGVYAQHVYSSLPEDLTLLQYLRQSACNEITDQHVQNVAGSFLFRGPDQEKKIRVLSGGERARVALASILLGGHNVLVLDEPVNHLDVETVDALAEALTAFKGTVVFTSHDRHFVRRVATQVIEVKGGAIRCYPGDYESYLYRVQQEIDSGDRDASGKKGATDGSRKKNGKKRHQLQKQVKRAEKKLEKLQAERAALLEELMGVTTSQRASVISQQQGLLQVKLDEQEGAWFALLEELEQLA